MENGISTQLAQAAVSVLAGAGLGLGYDLLRLPRLLLPGRLTTVLADLAFCLGALLGLFTLGLGPGGGQLRLFMLLCCGGGWGLWAAGPGRFFRIWEAALARLLARCAAKAACSAKKAAASVKKVGFFFKKLFPSGARWFTIIKNQTQVPPAGGAAPRRGGRPARHRHRGDAHEVQTLRDSDQGHRSRAGGLRRNPPADAARPDR